MCMTCAKFNAAMGAEDSESPTRFWHMGLAPSEGGRVSMVNAFQEGGTDVGDTAANAQLIAPGDEAFGTIGTASDNDVYEISVVAGTSYSISLIGDVTNGNALYYPAYSLSTDPSVFSGSAHSSSTPLSITYTATATGSFFIDISAFNNVPGDYVLSVYENDIAAGTNTSGDLQLGNAVVGQLGDNDDPNAFDDDWYAITLEAGQYYSATMTTEGADGYFSVYDSSGFFVAEDYFFDGLNIVWQADYDGTYFVSAGNDVAGEVGEYTIQVDQTAEPQTPTEDPLDSLDMEYIAPSSINVFFADGNKVLWDSFSGSFSSTAWSTAEQAAAVNAFAMIESVANVSFTVVNSITEADFAMVESSDATPFLGYWMSSVSGFLSELEYDGTDYPLQGWGVFNSDDATWTEASLQKGGYAFITLLHELGHGLGLAHPHDDGGNSSVMPGVTNSASLGFDQLNQGINTVMSYNDGWLTAPHVSTFGPPSFEYGYSASMMALDVAVLQQKYGANTATGLGDTVYSLPTFNGAGTFYETIWDAGGNDTITAAGTSADVVIELTDASLSYAEGSAGGRVSYVDGIFGGFTIANGAVIENAIGGSGDDVLLGNEAANTINGGQGDDFIAGGDGGDTLIGGGGIDDVSYQDSDAGVDVQLQYNIAQGGYAEGDNLSQIENLIGSDHNDTLTGNPQDNILVGADGNDFLRGLNGADELWGGDGDDWIYADSLDTFVNGGEGFDRLFVANGNGITVDITANSFDIAYGNTGNDTFDGGAADYNLSLRGLSGNDVLNGGSGDDYILGDAGSDELRGGDGLDRLYVDSMDTVIDGGGGTQDRIIVQARASDPSGVTVNMAASNVEVAFGGIRDDVFDGSSSTVALSLYGRSGADALTGGSNNDRLFGDQGGDMLNGGAGNDFLRGGTTGAGQPEQDVFIFDAEWGSDRIFDFANNGQEKIDFSSIAGIASLSDINLSQGTGFTSITYADNSGWSGSIRVDGIDVGDLSASDFIFI